MRERWWVSNYGPMDVIGGVERAAEKYCKILKMKYISARKLGIDINNLAGWEVSRRMDEILSGIPLEFLMYNSTNCWSKKPIADIKVCACNENFKREASSTDDIAFSRLKMVEWKYQQMSIANADKVLTVSKYEHDNLKEDLGVDSSILEGFVDLDNHPLMSKEDARYMMNLPREKKIYLFVGRRHIRKGYDVIVDLVKRHPESMFVNIVGQPFNDEPSNIREVGGITEETLNCYYNAADFLLVPSRYESFGNIFVEALAANLPIIGTKVGIAYDIPGEYIEFVDDVNADSFDKSMELADRRPFADGRKLAETRFSLESLNRRLSDLFK